MDNINFDHLACSPILLEVKDAMMPFLTSDIGNPLSKHSIGEKAKEALDEARLNIANLIGARPSEIIFTSCGSESNNLAIKGVASANSKKGKHIISTPIEHHSVMHPLRNLEKQGYEISCLKVDGKGAVDPNELKSLIRKDTILISVIFASNEIGTIEPIKEIGQIALDNGIIFHTDAVAAAGSLPINVDDLHVNLLSIAGNVFYGPQGTGALYVKKGTRIFPLIEGGIQESGIRAGSHNVAGIAGFGTAAKIAKERLDIRAKHLVQLRDGLINGVLEKIPECFLTGDRTNRLPGHASFCFKFIEGESILLYLNFSDIAGTSGSTCSSEALKVSHVLDAIGIDAIWAQGSISFTLGEENTIDEVDFLIKELSTTIGKLRQMSPITASSDFDKFKVRK